MKRYALTSLVLLLTIALLVGFGLLSMLFEISLLLLLVVCLALVVLCVILIRFSLKFDYQMAQIQKGKERGPKPK